MTKINPKQSEGKKAISNLLKLTSEAKKKLSKAEQIIRELEEQGVFN